MRSLDAMRSKMDLKSDPKATLRVSLNLHRLKVLPPKKSCHLFRPVPVCSGPSRLHYRYRAKLFFAKKF